MEFSKIINEILWTEWDPIGCDVPKDEYESYVPTILNLLLRNASEEEITDRLFHIETVNIALQGNKDRCRHVSKKLIAEKTNISELNCKSSDS